MFGYLVYGVCRVYGKDLLSSGAVVHAFRDILSLAWRDRN